MFALELALGGMFVLARTVISNGITGKSVWIVVAALQLSVALVRFAEAIRFNGWLRFFMSSCLFVIYLLCLMYSISLLQSRITG